MNDFLTACPFKPFKQNVFELCKRKRKPLRQRKNKLFLALVLNAGDTKTGFAFVSERKNWKRFEKQLLSIKKNILLLLIFFFYAKSFLHDMFYRNTIKKADNFHLSTGYFFKSLLQWFYIRQFWAQVSKLNFFQNKI